MNQNLTKEQSELLLQSVFEQFLSLEKFDFITENSKHEKYNTQIKIIQALKSGNANILKTIEIVNRFTEYAIEKAELCIWAKNNLKDPKQFIHLCNYNFPYVSSPIRSIPLKNLKQLAKANLNYNNISKITKEFIKNTTLSKKQLDLISNKAPIDLLYNLEQFDFINSYTPLNTIPAQYHKNIKIIQNLKQDTNPDNDELLNNLLLIKNKIPSYKTYLKILKDIQTQNRIPDSDQELINYISKLPEQDLHHLQQLSPNLFPLTHSIIQAYLDAKNSVKDFSTLSYLQIFENQDELKDLIHTAKTFNVLIPKASQQFLHTILTNHHLQNDPQKITAEYNRFLNQIKDPADRNAIDSLKHNKPSLDILNKLSLKQLQLFIDYKSNLPAFIELPAQ